jgi:hypothetical protein
MAASLLEGQSDVADDGIGELAMHLNVFLDGERIVVYVIDRPAVRQDSAKDVGENIGSAFLLFD